MGNSLRCCLACVLPCGALDVVRIVHLNGQVEEYSRPVSAGEILAANPNHIISKPCLQGLDHKIMIVSPDSDLKRGHIYFLIPESSLPEKKRDHKKKKKKKATKKHPKRSTVILEVSEQDYFLREVPSVKKSGHRRRKSGRVGAWRPHLQSISEDP